MSRMLGWQLLSLLQKDCRVAAHLVGLYTLDEDWKTPSNLPASYVINSDSNTGSGEHWLAVFIDKAGVVDYFDSYGTAPLEKIYKRLLALGHKDIRYNKLMLQGPISNSCGLYCAYFLYLRSYGIPMCSVLAPFQEYHFSYNEGLIRYLVASL